MKKSIIFLFVLFAVIPCKSKPTTGQKPAEGVTDTIAVIARWEADHPDYYMRFLRNQLLEQKVLNPGITKALHIEKPETVYWSVLQSGELALLNYDDAPATVRFDGQTIQLEPYSILVKRLLKGSSSGK
jgi:hypothetical protein